MPKNYSIQLTLLLVMAMILFSCKGKSGNEEGGTQGKVNTAQADTTDAAPSSVLKYKPPSDPAKEQAMQEASLNGDLSMVSRMIAEGADVNATDPEGRSALMYASFNGHNEVVSKLIEKGAIVSIRDAAGRTALLYASTGPFPETVKILLENNADPNIVDADEHFSPLMHAAAEGQLEVVKILLTYGADPSFKDIDGETAYLFAVTNGHTQVAELLKGK